MGSQRVGLRDFHFTSRDYWGFPGGSYGKESACNVGDLGLSLDWEDPLEEGMAIHSSVLAWRIPMENPHGQRSLVGYSPWGRKELDTTEQLSTGDH